MFGVIPILIIFQDKNSPEIQGKLGIVGYVFFGASIILQYSFRCKYFFSN